MDHSLLFSILGAIVSLGGVFIAIGAMKGKLSQAIEDNSAQSRQIESLATKSELTQAIKRSDEKLAEAIKHSDDMLELMLKRAEEDRAAGDGRYKELYGIINIHAERIAKLETSHAAVMKMLDEIKESLATGFKDVRDELKDLKKQG